MPISGHRQPPEPPVRSSEAPEHDWAAAMARVFPALRPGGMLGAPLPELDESRLAHEGTKKHAPPLVDPGPAELSIVYVLREAAYDVLIDADHLLGWGIEAQVLRDTAMENLRAWSATAPWSDELAGKRRLLSSDTGEGGDAARILLPEVRRHLGGECGGPARVLVGLPDRDLLVAGSLHPSDTEFAEQLATFVADVMDDAHEPIEGRLFELVGEEFDLVQFGG